LLKDVRENLPQLRDAMRELPAILRQLGEQAADGRIRIGLQSPELADIQKQLGAQRRQRYWLAVAATGVIAGTLVLTLGTFPWLGWSLLAGGALAGIAARP
jgi:ferric-dicitrate binding protein FerR (iron transport regulator)